MVQLLCCRTLKHVPPSSISTVYTETDTLVNNHIIGFTNLWWTFQWYNEVRKDTYISFHVHICTVSLYSYEDSSVNSTSLSVRCNDRSVKKDERVIFWVNNSSCIWWQVRGLNSFKAKLNWCLSIQKTSQNFTEWSSAISYMWDITDSWAFKVVLLTSYDM
jgi:hypothetical protein